MSNRIPKGWIDEKLKLKTIFAGYILSSLFFLASDVFLNGLDSYWDLIRGIFVFGTAVIAGAVYIIISPYEFKAEDLKDEVKSNKAVRNPETIVDALKNVMQRLTIDPEIELKSVPKDELESLKKAVDEL